MRKKQFEIKILVAMPRSMRCSLDEIADAEDKKTAEVIREAITAHVAIKRPCKCKQSIIDNSKAP